MGPPTLDSTYVVTTSTFSILTTATLSLQTSHFLIITSCPSNSLTLLSHSCKFLTSSVPPIPCPHHLFFYIHQLFLLPLSFHLTFLPSWDFMYYYDHFLAKAPWFPWPSLCPLSLPGKHQPWFHPTNRPLCTSKQLKRCWRKSNSFCRLESFQNHNHTWQGTLT